MKIKSHSNQLQTQMDSMQNEIGTMESRMNKMREQMSGAIIKQEALSLVEQIYELEMKCDQLTNESQQHMTPEQERQKLTTQVKEDNQEMAAMEKQINQLRERNENLKQAYENDDMQSSSMLVERQNKPNDDDNDTKQKYIELRRREQQIDDFTSTYVDTREQHLNDIKDIQKKNLTLVAMISRTLTKGNQAITHDDYTQLKSNIDQQEAEKRKSDDTLSILAEQHRKLKLDDMKVDGLGQKLTDEIAELKKTRKKMQADIEKFNDIDGLKRKAEKRQRQLTNDKSNMNNQRLVTRSEIQLLQSQFEAGQTKLQANETHIKVKHCSMIVDSLSFVVVVFN
jgi:hypothetical protein